MKEFFDFRLRERLAKTIFLPNEGKLIGDSVRLVIVERPSIEFDKIYRLDQDARRKNDFAVYSWGFKRKYTKKELQGSNLLALVIRKVFEPAGEECGTVYDESNACSYKYCGIGAIQSNSLKLPGSRLPRSQDIARTIAGEIVIAKRAVEAIRQEGLTGFSICPIFSPKTGEVDKEWSQLILDDMPTININLETQAGISPVEADEAGKYSCPGHVLGLRRLSELVIDTPDQGYLDFNRTKQAFGIRSGLLRPEYEIIVSQRAYRLLSALCIKGCDFEVVRYGCMTD